MANWKAEDKAWIVESTIFAKEVEVVNSRGGFVILRFKDFSGEMRLKESRLYKTKEETKKVANFNKKK